MGNEVPTRRNAWLVTAANTQAGPEQSIFPLLSHVNGNARAQTDWLQHRAENCLQRGSTARQHLFKFSVRFWQNTEIGERRVRMRLRTPPPGLSFYLLFGECRENQRNLHDSDDRMVARRAWQTRTRTGLRLHSPCGPRPAGFCRSPMPPAETTGMLQKMTGSQGAASTAIRLRTHYLIQKRKIAATVMAARKMSAHRSYRVWMRRQSLRRAKRFSILWRCR